MWQLEIADRLETTGGPAVRLAFHGGPDLETQVAERGLELLGERQVHDRCERQGRPSKPITFPRPDPRERPTKPW